MHVEELVISGAVGSKRGILFLLQCIHQGLGIFLLADGSHLNVIRTAARNGCGIGRRGANLGVGNGFGEFVEEGQRRLGRYRWIGGWEIVADQFGDFFAAFGRDGIGRSCRVE